MCGIVGVVAQRNATPILIRGLQRLEYRGYDSSGLAIVRADGALIRLREVGKVQNLVDAVERTPVTGGTGIAHTRWATHGKVTADNAHPHLSSSAEADQSVCLVHNGITYYTESPHHQPFPIPLVLRRSLVSVRF